MIIAVDSAITTTISTITIVNQGKHIFKILISSGSCLCQKLFLRPKKQANTISNKTQKNKLGLGFLMCFLGCKLWEQAGNTLMRKIITKS